MKTEHLETTLTIIRSLIALSLAMVVALLTLALARWMQAEGWLSTSDTTSYASFLIPMLLGGIGAGAVLPQARRRVAIGHGLGFAGLCLLMLFPGWLASEDIGAGLITGITAGVLVLTTLGAFIGHWIRTRLSRRNE
jgi:H+/gluconate symporter-like permease